MKTFEVGGRQYRLSLTIGVADEVLEKTGFDVLSVDNSPLFVLEADERTALDVLFAILGDQVEDPKAFKALLDEATYPAAKKALMDEVKGFFQSLGQAKLELMLTLADAQKKRTVSAVLAGIPGVEKSGEQQDTSA